MTKGMRSTWAEARSWVSKRQPWVEAAASFAGLLVLYWTHRCLTFGPGDGAQHVVAALTWGVPKGPGYPLLVALGHFIAQLPLGPAAGRVNGLSSLLHAAASAVFFVLLRRQGARPLAAAAATALLSLSPLYWYYSEVAEARALNDLLAVSTALLAWSYAERPRPGLLAALAICVGLGLSHHPTFALILPAVAVLLRRRSPTPTQAAWAAGLAAACCALPYILLGLRLHDAPAAYNFEGTRSWSDLLALFLRRSSGGPLKMFDRGGILGFDALDLGKLLLHGTWLASSAWANILPTGLTLAGLGAWSLRRGRALAFWMTWIAATAAYFLLISSQQFYFDDVAYIRGVLARFYLLPFIGVFALAGFGLEWLMARVRAGLQWAFLAMAIGAPLLLRPIQLRGHDLLLDYIHGLRDSSGPSDMLVLASDDSAFAAAYVDLVERAWDDRVVLVPAVFDYPPYIEQLRRRHPTLALPLSSRGLATDWSQWLALNPTRRLLGESPLLPVLRKLNARVQPSGLLVDWASRPRPLGQLTADARVFSELAPSARISRWDVYDFTQEVYVLRAYRMTAEWYLELLGSKRHDAALALQARLAAL